MTTQQIAQRLIELCLLQNFSAAREELYATDATSTEPNQPPIKGLAAMAAKEKNWHNSIQTIHGISISEPLVTDHFICISINWDITYKKQERSGWKELALFEVKDQQIVSEKFYY